MKQINQYIQESILDDEDDILQNNDWIVEQWLKDNYKIVGTYTIKNFIIDVNGYVMVKNFEITNLLPGGYNFGKVTKSFECSYCRKLTSLKGAPEMVEWDFDCSNCDELHDLEWGPKIVHGSFSCSRCKNLTSLKGCPQIIKKTLFCCLCPKLTNLKYITKKVNNIMCYENPNLISLEGCPVRLNEFSCSNCEKLESLKGCPQKVKAFNCSRCKKLTTLENGPQIIKDILYCDKCGVKFEKDYIRQFILVTHIFN